jgi:hypothetical protein
MTLRHILLNIIFSGAIKSEGTVNTYDVYHNNLKQIGECVGIKVQDTDGWITLDLNTNKIHYFYYYIEPKHPQRPLKRGSRDIDI